MSVTECAQAALRVFPNTPISTSAGVLPLPVVMLAIGGAESGWTTDAAGDSLSELEAYAAAHPGVQVYYPPSWATCNGYSAWGWLQVNWSHYAYLESVTGSQNPCDWAAWLYDPIHCAEAALAIYQQAGLSAWGSYTSGRWLAYLGQAEQAIPAANSLQATPQTQQITVAIGRPSTLTVVLLGLGAIGVGAIVAGILAAER